jgi:tetratricopeptide (TPR) repeat protein
VLDRLRTELPEDLGLERQRILLLADLGQYEEALAAVERYQSEGETDGELSLLRAGLLARLGQPELALAAYRTALAEYPDRSEQIYLLMAALLEETDQGEALESLLREAVGRVPESRTLRIGLLRFLVDADRTAEARRVAQQADSLAAVSPAADDRYSYALELADLLVREDRVTEAIDVLEEARAADRLGRDALLWLARLHLSGGETADARALVAEVRRRWPESGEAEYLLGEMIAADGDYEAALPHLRRAAELEPYRPDVRVGLVQCLILAGGPSLEAPEPSSDVADIEAELAEQAPVAATLLAEGDYRGAMILGNAFRMIGDLERAAEQFAIAAGSDDYRYAATMQEAICRNELGDFEAAKTLLENLRRDRPDDPGLANTLGYLLAEQGENLERAERLIRSALEQDPENGAFLDSLGWVHFQRGEYEQAFDVLVQAANSLPEDPVILEHLGRTLGALGQTQEAVSVLQRALRAGGARSRIEPLLRELEQAEGP